MHFLNDHGITFERFDHPAVFTCEESEKLDPMPGTGTKNLFLVDGKKTRTMLVSVEHGRKTDLKALAGILGLRRVSFGSAEHLKASLGVDPGSVTALGLINDPDHHVEFFIDRPIWEAASVQWHPLVNTATLVIPHADIEKFLAATGHAVQVIDVPYAD